MFTRPNDTLNDNLHKSYESTTNHIGRKFAKIFKILTSTNYYDGTLFSEFYDQLYDDGRSKIYVYDPLEKELQKVMISKMNEIKYLVGLTGMGKTTLLRNFFKISKRDVKIVDNNIIIYISFYYSDLSSDSPKESVDKEIIKYLSRTVKAIFKENYDIIENQKQFWEGVYDFILDNKPIILETDTILPGKSLIGEVLGEISYESKMEKLKEVAESEPLEYYSSIIKYSLRKKNQPFNIMIIYDDVESKSDKFHKPIVEAARHLHSCFTAIESNMLHIKTIVSMRAYTFRCNIGRQSEARREDIHNDVILKDQAVKLHDIFEKRFLVFEEMLRTREGAKNKNSYDDAKRQMQYVEKQLDKVGSDLIFNLSNYNLSNALKAYCNVLINLEWIPCSEREYKGAFKINAQNYRITTENIIHAIANGNSKNYISNNGYIPNILYNDNDGTTLISLYIIKSLLLDRMDKVYGEKYIEGIVLLSKIRSIFVNLSDSSLRMEFWNYKVNDVLEHLFASGVLLRSIYDIEIPNEDQIERKFRESYKLYLSPRGKCLFEFLDKNAVLLELYRDDIYTDLKNNDKLTSQLSTDEIFDYLLEYICECFRVETRNIGVSIPNLKRYQDIVGDILISSILLEGVVRNMYSYFQKEDKQCKQLICKAKKIFVDMISYARDIFERYHINYKISDYLMKNFNDFY